MSFYEFIQSETSWQAFLEKEEIKEFKDHRLIKAIKRILKYKSYEKFTTDYLNNFKLPKKIKLGKLNSSKKRIVYVYPSLYRTILKLTSNYMLQYYNNTFCINSLAYTEGKSVKTAFSLLKKYKITKDDIVYKADFTDYFNTIDINLLEGKLKVFLKDNIELFNFIMRLLKEERVIIKNKEVIEKVKGVMAGSPIAGILANIYMHDVDTLMLKNNYKYIRYADDVLIVGEEAFNFFTSEIAKLKVDLNPKKTSIVNIETGITFLGFFYKDKIIDISDDARKKMKSRMKRRAKWYRVWMIRRGVNKESALRDYIVKINYKLFSDTDDSINWSRWYLPNINVIKTIKYLDNYFVDCIRYLDSGTWKKGKHFYRLKYKDIKALGFKSLVNEYYKLRKPKETVVYIEG